MTHFFERTALLLLAGTALTACVSPNYPINPPLLQVPPPAVPPTVASPRTAAAPLEPLAEAPKAPAPVETTPLAPLPAARPPAPQPGSAQASKPPMPAFAAPAEDAAAKSRSRSGAAATYTVRRGDTLAEIAGRLGTDVEALAEANGLERPYRLQPGQVLKNPKAPTATAKTYTVRRGDTLFGIAQRFGTTLEALRAENGLGRSASIMPGRKLRLPGSGQAEDSAEAAEVDAAPVEVAEPERRTVTNREVTGRVVDISIPGKSYKVKKGDNLERVANRLDSDVAELAKLNKLKKPYRLQPGQTIRGPGGSAKAYVVGRGDTLAEVGQRFGVSVEALRNANGLRRGASLAPGRRLRLPPGYRDRGPITTTARAPDPPTRPDPAPLPPPERPRSSFDTPPPADQVLPPPQSAPRPPAVVLPDTPQPYRPSGVPSAPQPYRPPPSSVPAPPQPYRPPPSGVPAAPQPYRPPPSGVLGAPVATPPPADAQIAQMGRGLFVWPIQGAVISGFGVKGAGQRNDGLNMRANTGDPVRAAAAGDVVYAGDQVPGFGNLVLIKHADGWVTAYGHLSRVEVRMQQKVTQGQQIGQAGSSGGVSEPQLHFEVRYAPSPQERARPVDPGLVLPPR